MESTKSLEKWMEGFAKVAEEAGVAPEQVSTLVKLAHRVSLQQKFPAAFEEGFDKAAAEHGITKEALSTWRMMKGLGKGMGVLGMLGLGAGIGDYGIRNTFGAYGALPTQFGMGYEKRRTDAAMQAEKQREAITLAGMTPQQRREYMFNKHMEDRMYANQIKALEGDSPARMYESMSWAR